GHLAAIQTALPTGPDDTNTTDDIVLVDLATGARQPATRSSSGCPGNGPAGEPTLSGDGSAIGFTSEADDLAGSDNHRITNVYVREMIGPRTERISTAPSTTPGSQRRAAAAGERPRPSGESTRSAITTWPSSSWAK